MVYIKKGSEPHSLEYFRLATPNATYDGLPTDCKHDIRERLLSEQGHLCAYCMGRIRMDSITIEHYIPQGIDILHEHDLEYKNMLGVCSGLLYGHETCGKKRGKEPLTVDPRNSNTVEKIAYSENGTILSSDSNFSHDLADKLNLNTDILIENRRRSLHRLIAELQARKNKGVWRDLAMKYINKLNEDAVKQEYYGILLFYLKKKTR